MIAKYMLHIYKSKGKAINITDIKQTCKDHMHKEEYMKNGFMVNGPKYIDHWPKCTVYDKMLLIPNIVLTHLLIHMFICDSGMK